jgi:flagellar basal body rod protein FlgG
MAYLQKDHSMAINGNDGALYRLARDGTFNVQEFGPAMTLSQAQRYQADMLLANVPVLVVRCNAL